MVLVANVSSAAIDDQDQDVISDRRYRWDSSEQDSGEEPKYLEQADDVEDDEDQDSDSDQDDDASGSDEDGSIYVVSEWYEPLDGKSWEELESESDESDSDES